MEEKKYYLPIKSTSLAHYFGSACIKPSKYFKNKPEDILQDKFCDFLLVTTHFGTQQADCCLELVFTEQEKNDLIDKKNGFYLYEKPLPITRVRKIYFTSNERKGQTIANINMSTAFVPENLVEVDSKFDNCSLDGIEKTQDKQVNSYDDKLWAFNSLLGGFALLQTAREDYMNYSENYFSSLAAFSNTIAQELSKSNKQFKNLFADDLYKETRPFLKKNIDEATITIEAKKAGQEIVKNETTRVINLSKLNGLPYILSLISSYGVGEEAKRFNIDGLILSKFHEPSIKPELAEIIALCYGLNKGYTVFNNYFKAATTDKVFVKFQLNSKLDYYTIESLYQYVFNKEKQSGNFPYLDDWCPKFENEIKTSKTNYQILDVVVIGKKKPKVLSKEYWRNLLPSFFQGDKLLEKKLPELFQDFGEIVFNDTKEELEDSFNTAMAAKQEEIALKQKEIDELKKSAQELSTKSVEDKSSSQESVSSVPLQDTIYNDKKEGIEESFSTKIVAKQEEIDDKQMEIEESKKSVQELSIKNVENKTSSQECVSSVPVQDANNEPKQDVKKLVEQVLAYKNKNLKMLKDEAKSKGIEIPKGAKVDEIILLLMTTPKSNPKLF